MKTLLKKIYFTSLLVALLINTVSINPVYADCSPFPSQYGDWISCNDMSSNTTSGAEFDTSDGDDVLTNYSGGIINMILLFGDGVDQLLNQGIIYNPVNFGASNDVYTYGYDWDNGGTLDGYINMSDGEDILTIAKDFNPSNKDTAFFSGITENSIIMGYGSDTLTVNSGVTLSGNVISSGYSYISSDYYGIDWDGSDTFYLQGVMYGNIWLGGGSDTFTTGGSATGSALTGNIYGGGGDDTILLNDGTSMNGTVDCGPGWDTLTATNDILNSSNGCEVQYSTSPPDNGGGGDGDSTYYICSGDIANSANWWTGTNCSGASGIMPGAGEVGIVQGSVTLDGDATINYALEVDNMLTISGTLTNQSVLSIPYGGTIAGNMTSHIVNNNSINISGSLYTGGIVTNNGTVSSSGTLNAGSGTIHNNGTIVIGSGSSFTYSGVLDGTYNLETSINSGSIEIAGILNINNGGSVTSNTDVSILSNGTLSINNGGEFTPANNFSFNAGTINIYTGGGFLHSQPWQIDGTLNIYGQIYLNNGHTWTLGTGTLNISNSGLLQIDNSSDLVVQNGTLNIGGSFQAYSSGASVINNGGTINLIGGSLMNMHEDTLFANHATINVSNDGTLIVNGALDNSGTFVMNGPMTMGSSATFSNTQSFSIGSGGIFTNNGAYTGNSSSIFSMSSSSVVNNGGTITNDGQWTVASGATINNSGILVNNKPTDYLLSAEPESVVSYSALENSNETNFNTLLSLNPTSGPYVANALPDGLTINTNTGEITGSISSPTTGTFTVSTQGGTVSQTFEYSIALPPAFISTWKTDNTSYGSSNSTSIRIPTGGAGYNYDVDWNNDGIYDQFGITGDVEHDYGVAGTYTIRIRGDFPRIFFNYGGDRLKFLSIKQWGPGLWTSMMGSFAGCENFTGITATDTPNMTGMTDISYAFYGATNFNGNINNWDVSQVTNMSQTFLNASSFNQPLDQWDTSNVTNMLQLFKGATAFNQNIGMWDVSHVTNMYNLFVNASSFNQPLNNWDISAVTEIRSMFFGASSFNQPLDQWDTSHLTDLTGMFAFGATAFNQDISMWDVSNVLRMDYMFNGATSFNQDLSAWNTSKVTSMWQMFMNASSFDQDLGSWDVTSVVDMADMFNGAALSTTNYDALLTGWSGENVKSNVNFHGGSSKFCNLDARNMLVSQKGWNITDSGSDVYEDGSSCTTPRPKLLSIISYNADGTYGKNAIVSIIANFDKELGPDSTMNVVLDTGATVQLTVVNGFTLSGNYIVGPLEHSDDLTVSSLTGTIKNTLGDSFSVSTVPASPNNLGDMVNIIIDAVPPTITVNPRKTNDRTPSMTGVISESDAVVKITINGQTFDANNQGDGTWRLSGSVMSSELADGYYNVIAEATDAIGNSGIDETTNELEIDGTAPAALGIPDMTPDTDTGISTKDNITADMTPDFTGFCESGSTVQLIIDSVPRESFTACENNSYRLTAPSLTDGNHNIAVITADTLNNTSAPSMYLSITIDTNVPAAPVLISPLSNPTPIRHYVFGQFSGEPFNTGVVIIRDKTTGVISSITTNAQGTISY